MKILSIGECMGEFSGAGGGLYRFGFAGDTLNTAWYLRALVDGFDTVDYFTAVGTDRVSDDLVGFIAGNGIGIGNIRRIPDRTIGLYLITLTGAERAFTYWRDTSAARLLAADGAALAAAMAAADCIYFSGITLAILSPDHRATLLAAAAVARRRGKTIAFDSNIRRRLWRSEREIAETLGMAYRVATVALPTFDDDSPIFGDRAPEDCAARLAGYGVAEAVVKCGAGSSILCVGGETFAVAPDPVADLVDTTGAGDSFNAGYLAARLAGRTPRAAAMLAHRVAGRVIGQRGALIAMASLADLRIAPTP